MALNKSLAYSEKGDSMTRLFYAFLIAFFVIGIDQASKAWILYDMMNPPAVIPVLPFLDIVLTWNKGVGFGLLQAHTLWGSLGLIGMALAISIILGIWLWRTTDKLLLVSLSMIIGGGHWKYY